MFAPYGLGIEWPEDFEGRYISWKTQLSGIHLQPTIAYQLIPGRLSIGGAPQIVLGGLELNQYVEARTADAMFSQMPPEVDLASGTIEGSGTGIGGQVGLFYQHSDRLSLGVRYMHSVTVELTGDATFEQQTMPGVPDAMTAPLFQPGAPFGDQGVAAGLTFPAQAVVGFRFAATPELDVAFDYQWTGWSSFDEIDPDFDNLQMPPLVLNYVTPDATVTPILPEAERFLLTAGLGYDLGVIRADLFYNLVNQADRRGRVRSADPDRPGQTGAQLNVGTYESTAHLFGLTLSYGFGTVR